MHDIAALVRLNPVAAPLATGAVALAGCALVAVVDPNRSGVFPSCPFKVITGLDCPGCGATRAVHALTRGDLLLAVDLNVLLVVALPFLVWSWAAWMARSAGRAVLAGPQLPARAVRPIPVVIAAFWVLRNLPWAPLSALGT